MISEPLIVEVYPFKVRWSIERCARPTFNKWDYDSSVWHRAKDSFADGEFFVAYRVTEVFLGTMLVTKEKEEIEIGRYVSDYTYDDNEEPEFDYDERTLEQALLEVSDLSCSRIAVSNAWVDKVANLISFYETLENWRGQTQAVNNGQYLDYKYPHNTVEAIIAGGDLGTMLALRTRLSNCGIEPSDQLVQNITFIQNQQNRPK